MSHWTRWGSTCPPRLVPLCTVLCLFTERLTHLLLCVAALQEQRVALGAQYEVPEVSVGMYRKIVLHHAKETVYHISGLIVFRYSYECMTSY